MDSNSTEAHISRRTTIIDVAKMSGVSPKTVLALNDEPHVSARVRQLVKDAAAKPTIIQI
jgi:LacI family transcriptional regulator